MLNCKCLLWAIECESTEWRGLLSRGQTKRCLRESATDEGERECVKTIKLKSSQIAQGSAVCQNRNDEIEKNIFARKKMKSALARWSSDFLASASRKRQTKVSFFPFFALSFFYVCVSVCFFVYSSVCFLAPTSLARKKNGLRIFQSRTNKTWKE